MKKLLFYVIMLAAPLFCYAQSAEEETVAKAKKLHDDAIELIHTKRFNEGMERFKEIENLPGLRADVKAENYMYMYALCLDSLDEKESALNYALKAEALYPEALKAYEIQVAKGDSVALSCSMAPTAAQVALLALERYDEAISALERQIVIVDGMKGRNIDGMEDETLLFFRVQAYYGIAGVYDKKKDYANCFEACQKALDEGYKMYRGVEDENMKSVAYALIGTMYSMSIKACLRQDDIKQAMFFAKKTRAHIADAPEPIRSSESMALYAPMALLEVVDAYKANGELMGALNIVDQAITWPFSNFHAFLHDKRGDILLALGDEAEARRCWERTKSIVPDFYHGVDEESYPLRKFGE